MKGTKFSNKIGVGRASFFRILSVFFGAAKLDEFRNNSIPSINNLYLASIK
jgi:hypothetical protein